jgi:20S proteasome alpha/beta subunit
MIIRANNLGKKAGTSAKFRKPPMSLILGIVCKDSLVMACETQTSNLSFNTKSLGTKKITLVQCGGAWALIAEAGVTSLSNAAVGAFQRNAAALEVVGEDSIVNCVIKSVREVKADQMEMYPGTTAEQQQSFFLNDLNTFDLLVAYYFDNKPFLYRVNVARCLPDRPQSFFEACGIGGDLAAFILKESGEPQMSSDLATAMAIYAIEKVNAHNLFCGGDMQVVKLNLVPRHLFPATESLVTMPQALPIQDIFEIRELIRESEQANAKAHRDLLSRRLAGLAQARFWEAMNAPHPTEGMELY